MISLSVWGNQKLQVSLGVLGGRHPAAMCLLDGVAARRRRGLGKAVCQGGARRLGLALSPSFGVGCPVTRRCRRPTASRFWLYQGLRLSWLLDTFSWSAPERRAVMLLGRSYSRAALTGYLLHGDESTGEPRRVSSFRVFIFRDGRMLLYAGSLWITITYGCST